MTSTPVEAVTVYPGLSEGAALITTKTVNVPSGRPTSTVALPTPPVGSTDDRPPGAGSAGKNSTKGAPPMPPPRWDSATAVSTGSSYGSPSERKLRLDIKSAQQRGAKSPTPPPPPQFSNHSPLEEEHASDMELPSYDQAVARLSRSPDSTVNSEAIDSPSREEQRLWASGDNQIIAPPSPFSSDENPFQRDGFGRQSMSEKRGRGTLDATQSEYYNKREKDRSGSKGKILLCLI